MPIFSNIAKISKRHFIRLVNEPEFFFLLLIIVKSYLKNETSELTSACLLLSSTTTRDEQTSAAMTAREREKATHEIGVVRQGGWLHARRSGRWVERGNGRPKRKREGDEEGIAINDETRMQEGNARKKKRRGGGGGEWW